MRPSSIVVVLVVCFGIVDVASATTQPDGTPIPTGLGCHAGNPAGLAAIFACQCTTSGVCNIGAACPGNQDPNSCDNGQHGTCETTLWHNWNDDTCIPSNQSGLSPQNDGATTPETFQPTCALTFTLLSRGTAQFRDVFGWYNVTASKPDVNDLHVMLDCNATAGTQVVLDVLNDPAYKGGEIGFFIATPESWANPKQCANGNCCSSIARLVSEGYVYYSQRQFNPDAAGAQSYIHLLTYDSTITPRKFYFAWEDLFTGGGNNDFSDIVTSVEGVECSGGGQLCDTGKPGLCSEGVSLCDGGVLGCSQLYTPTAEACDGVDQDCDSQVDEDATCPPDHVCDRGECRPNCSISVEFACGTNLVCDSTKGICIDPACQGVTCPEGKVCKAGACVGACDGITCPYGYECFLGQCVNRCEDVTCGAGQVCIEGACFPGCGTCEGIQCATGLACSGGQCADPSCPNGCPNNKHCVNGACVDNCEGAVCPQGQVCRNGRCDVPGDGDGDGDGGGASPGGCGCASSAGFPFHSLPIVFVLFLVVSRRSRARRPR